MNYQHIYHAGNFTEVVKHAVLLLIIEYLHKKPAPVCFIDTHAGMGIYDLKSVEAEKTQESINGIQKIMQIPKHPPEIEKYLQIVSSLQNQDNAEIRYYPGSPWFILANQRPQDRLIVNEFHPLVFEQLKKNLKAKKQIFFHHRDAYEFLPAILPPIESRGLVLIDPPFENKLESVALAELLQKSLQRWLHGVYLIWFPITALRPQPLEKIISESKIQKYLQVELTILDVKKENKGLLGCQLLIINPTWRLTESLNKILPYLWDIFRIKGQGKWSIFQSE